MHSNWTPWEEGKRKNKVIFDLVQVTISYCGIQMKLKKTAEVFTGDMEIILKSSFRASPFRSKP